MMKRFALNLCALLISLGCLLACVTNARGQIVPVLPATAPSTRPTTAAARPAPPVGDYLGTIKAGAIALRIGLKLEAAGDGFKGVLDSIDQGSKIPIDRVEFSDGKLKLTLDKIGGSYEGAFKDGGESIEGKWTQGGQALPLTFKRVAEAVTLKRPQEPKPPLPYKQEKVTVPHAAAGVKLAGTLTLPKSAGPFPAVLLITGSGPQDRDEMVMGHRPFLILADHLTRQGIAVLRLDDRGVGESTGDFATATGDDFVADAEAALAFLRARKDVDPKRVGLLGHSEGGITAPRVAAKDPGIAFVVLLAAPGVPMEQLLLRQSLDVARQMGGDEARLRAMEATNRELFAMLKTIDDPAEAERRLHAFFDREAAKLSPTSREAFKASGAAEVQVKMFLTPWFRQLVKYDPAPTLAKVKCPVLAVNGERDVQVAAKENLAAAGAALRSGGNRDVTIVELPGLNHLLQHCTTGAVTEYATIEETMAPEALKQISDWLATRAGLAPPAAGH
jgi:pimeloyl-ACP methyl ester carboxylesterase